MMFLCPAAPEPRAGRDSRGRDAHAESAVRDFPADPARGISRPTAAPAYYLGHPARVWINAMRSRRGRNTSDHRIPAVTSGGKPIPFLKGGPVTGTEAGAARAARALTSPVMRAR
jgi:hypothetical protein